MGRFGFVTLGANVPSTRFRFDPFAPLLRQRGHDCRYWPSYPAVYDHFESIGWRASYQLKRANRLMQYAKAHWFRPQTIYLERGCFHDNSLWLDRWFRDLAPRFVLDVDDAIFLQFPEKLRELISWSDHIVVSNPPLAQYVSQYHDRITEIPTCVSLANYPLRPTSDQSTALHSTHPTIGWMGTPSNLPFLAICAPALRRLAREHTFQLLVISNDEQPLRAIDWTGVNLIFEKWNKSNEVSRLHQMDIGLMPLPEDQEWMRYKAATKLVQYMAIGIPAVASPIGVNADILRDSIVGFAAQTEDQWFESLRTLISSPELRRTMGLQGRKLVESKFCAEANLDKLEQVLTG